MIYLLIALVTPIIAGFLLDKLQNGGNGVWYGTSEPPEGFVGFWDRGETVEQWPRAEDKIVAYDMTEEDLIANAANFDSIRADSMPIVDIIPDPYRPGYLTTKQELAKRRSDD